MLVRPVPKKARDSRKHEEDGVLAIQAQYKLPLEREVDRRNRRNSQAYDGK
jgi:hypothetical protein